MTATSAPSAGDEGIAGDGTPVTLFVSHREWPTRALASALETGGHRVLVANSLPAALAVLAVVRPDALFVDLRRSDDRDAVCSALRTLVAGDGNAMTPVIGFASAVPDRDMLLAVLEAGAWEVIAVPCDTAALVTRCATWRRARCVAERWRALAVIDAGTGLHTADAMHQRARELGATMMRLGLPLACVVVDIGLGDERTRIAAADAVRTTLRASDVAGWMGAEAIAVLAPGVDGVGAAILADRLYSALTAAPVALAGETLRVGVRCEVPTRWNSGDGASILARTAAAADAAVFG